MATPTATIRVPAPTRDCLAAQARERGISIAALLTELAARAEHEAAFRAEREATRAEAADDQARTDDHDWADTVDDGIA